MIDQYWDYFQLESRIITDLQLHKTYVEIRAWIQAWTQAVPEPVAQNKNI